MKNLVQVVLSFLSSPLLPATNPVQNVEVVLPFKSIAVVGAGTAGLAALKTLLDLPEHIRKDWEIVLFEQRSNVGGLWLPDPHDAHPPDLPETPLYPLLHTNIPVPTMTPPGFPFPPNTALFPSHDRVEQYHQDYAQHFNLYPYIRLNHTVASSSWIGDSTAGHWDVVVRNHEQEELRKSFDHLIVANGHFHYPHVPHFNGQEDWLAGSPSTSQSREILHALWYRLPSRYVNQTVLVIGSGPSSQDLASQIAPFAKTTYHSVRGKFAPANGKVVTVPEVSHFTSDAVVFVDGSTVTDIDSVLLGTGYDIRIPFLEASGELSVLPNAHSNETYLQGLVTNMRYIFPLHEHIFSLSPSYPTSALAFIGQPVMGYNFPSDTVQGTLVAHVLANSSLLPPREDMLRQLAVREENMRLAGFDPYYVGHRMIYQDTFDYQDSLMEYLKQQGAIPQDGKKYVEKWRREAKNDQCMKRGWKRIEQLGIEEVWLQGVESEEDWVELMVRVNEWQHSWEAQNHLTYPIEPFFS
ncbi:FAD/NAD(P)-binding domain-containing protein [Leucogyrophana mollusca]|uniref:FAD/NAD(P)-binding domain-containing protein n=1 Tax=Leucogyrophana mollusca TaxID=85980 RepID=A0ACB8BRI1_9AGAM|nr:FAD/NAD(P)-binding domain-containing protein [Leucogyrophana mollusca]